MNTSATTEASQLDALIQRINQLSTGGAQSFQPAESAPRVRESVQPTMEAASSVPQATCSPEKTAAVDRDEPFIPAAPASLLEAGLSEALVEELMMRFLLARGEAMGRMIADQLQLPFRLIEPILNLLKL